MIREGVEYSFIRREYGQQVAAAGGQPIFLDSTIDPEVAAELCDGIIISGGEDIQPEFYGQSASQEHKQEPAARTAWENRLIDACDKRGIHILGVCYGMQLLNIHYGGTLYQDIAAEQGPGLYHGSSDGAAMQRVQFTRDFLGFQQSDSVATAHRHHQAVRKLAHGMHAIATTEDTVVEAIAGHGHYGIQWHSESDGTASNIYGAFIDIVAGRAPEPALELSPFPEIA